MFETSLLRMPIQRITMICIPHLTPDCVLVSTVVLTAKLVYGLGTSERRVVLTFILRSHKLSTDSVKTHQKLFMVCLANADGLKLCSKSTRFLDLMIYLICQANMFKIIVEAEIDGFLDFVQASFPI